MVYRKTRFFEVESKNGCCLHFCLLYTCCFVSVQAFLQACLRSFLFCGALSEADGYYILGLESYVVVSFSYLIQERAVNNSSDSCLLNGGIFGTRRVTGFWRSCLPIFRSRGYISRKTAFVARATQVSIVRINTRPADAAKRQ